MSLKAKAQKTKGSLQLEMIRKVVIIAGEQDQEHGPRQWRQKHLEQNQSMNPKHPFLEAAAFSLVIEQS